MTINNHALTISLGLFGIFCTAPYVEGASDSVLSFECEFDKHYAAYLNQDKTEKFIKGTTYMSIINGRTSNLTQKLDGSERATNSIGWELVRSNDLDAHYIGDDGDILTIVFIPNDRQKRYLASLQWTALGYAFSSIGTCSI